MEILELFVICILDPIQELSTDTRWRGSVPQWASLGSVSLINTDLTRFFGDHTTLRTSLLLKAVQYTPENSTTRHQLCKVLGETSSKRKQLWSCVSGLLICLTAFMLEGRPWALDLGTGPLKLPGLCLLSCSLAGPTPDVFSQDLVLRIYL